MTGFSRERVGRDRRRCIKFRAGSSCINVAENFSVVPRVLLVSPLPLRRTEMPKLSSGLIASRFAERAHCFAVEKQKNVCKVTPLKKNNNNKIRESLDHGQNKLIKFSIESKIM